MQRGRCLRSSIKATCLFWRPSDCQKQFFLDAIALLLGCSWDDFHCNFEANLPLRIPVMCVQIREDTKTGIYVDGLTEEYVSNVKDVMQLLIKVFFFWVSFSLTLFSFIC
jgi:hypothetical protein